MYNVFVMSWYIVNTPIPTIDTESAVMAEVVSNGLAIKYEQSKRNVFIVSLLKRTDIPHLIVCNIVKAFNIDNQIILDLFFIS